MKKVILLVISFIILTGYGSVLAQGVCVIDEIVLFKFQGIVRQADKQVVKGASIQVYKKSSDKKPVTELSTDSSGHFLLNSLKKGKYSIAVSYPNFVRLVFPVVISGNRELIERQLVVEPGWDYTQTCGGGGVSFVDDASIVN